MIKINCSGHLLLVGQYSGPVTGEMTCNKFVKNILESTGRSVVMIDSNLLKNASDVGVFSLVKFWRALIVIFLGIKALRRSSILYITPGQTIFGIARCIPLLIFAKILHIPSVLHWHGYGILSIASGYLSLLKIVFRLSSKNILLTNDLLLKLIEIGAPRKKFNVVRNFSCYEPLVEIRKSSGRLRVLYLGSLTFDKGYHIFLEAVKSCGHLDFIACGSGDSSLVEASYNIAKKFSNFKYLGVVSEPEKREIIIGADIFVLLTNYKTEGVPLSILDAISCGLAVITTPHNGIPETLGDAACWLTSPDAEQLTIVLQALDLDRSHLHDLKDRALAKSLGFRSSIFAEKMIDVFNEFNSNSIFCKKSVD